MTHPKDVSGQTRRCHECCSDQHLIAKCPKLGKGGGKPKGRHFLSNEPEPRRGEAEGIWSGVARNFYQTSNGPITEDINDDVAEWKEVSMAPTEPERGARQGSDTGGISQVSWNFPWREIEGTTESYHVRTRMKDRPGEALLVDHGSPENLW